MNASPAMELIAIRLARCAARCISAGILALSSVPWTAAQRVENDTIQVPVEINELPQLLSETGLFSDLATLEPEPGIIPYEPILSFWSDHALKSRWVYIPYEEQIGFEEDRSWSFPTGSIWVKHFDLEMERGNPDTRRKIETRLLVKTGFGVYGVSYQWNEAQTDATLVGDDAVPLVFDIVENGESREQHWAIPSRTECLVCHTFSGGMALSFNTRQLNHEIDVEGQTENFIKYLSDIGVLDTDIETPEILPRHSTSEDTEYSLDHQARSYLAVNCSYCHSPGGGIESDPFDARPFRTLDRTGLIDEAPNLDYGNELVKQVTRGSHELSALWLTMTGTTGAGRMPPLSTNERDFEGEALIQRWINEALPGYLSFDEWQAQHFSDTSVPEANEDFDADEDGDSNYLEYLSRTDPNDPMDRSELLAERVGSVLQLDYTVGPFAEYQFEESDDLANWRPLDSENNPIRTPVGEETRLETELLLGAGESNQRYIRLKTVER